QQHIHKNAGEDCENEREIYRDSLWQAGNEFSQPSDVRARTNLSRLHNRITGNLVMILREVTYQRDGDEVQHDRVDDFMRSELRFEYSRDASPNCSRANRGDATHRHK